MTDLQPQPTPPARYYWLWHLAAMNVIQADFGPSPAPPADKAVSSLRAVSSPKITGTAWDLIAEQGTGSATVALIDTGTSRRHPNLKDRIDPRSIDLTTHRYGARYGTFDGSGYLPPTAGDRPGVAEGRAKFFSALKLGTLADIGFTVDERAWLTDLAETFRTSEGRVLHLAEPEEMISSHGTACAGLMVGCPALVPGGEGAVLLPGGAINPNPNLLPYFGVDPEAKLLSIRTSFEDDAVQFIAALLYAFACEADVIVMPRGLPDQRPGKAQLEPLTELTQRRNTYAGREVDDLIDRLPQPGLAPELDPNGIEAGRNAAFGWAVLEKLLVAVSKRIPIFCAAGNDGESQLIYPASLARADNGIFAVGAVTAEGFRSGYSSYGENLSLVMPSDDFEILNRHQTRIDTSDPLLRMHNFGGLSPAVVFCPLDLVTTDLPGVFGYDKGSAPWSSLNDPGTNPGAGGGYYTAFGGTSGASCLAAGLAVLAQRARRVATGGTWTGIEMKALLCPATPRLVAVAPGTRVLTPDAMNNDDDPAKGARHFFGAGLPDAMAVIRASLNMS